jgi:hypothetical protein
MLQAYTILQHQDSGNGQHDISAVEMESMFDSFQLMERFACFPHMHSLNDGREHVKRRVTSPPTTALRTPQGADKVQRGNAAGKAP